MRQIVAHLEEEDKQEGLFGILTHEVIDNEVGPPEHRPQITVSHTVNDCGGSKTILRLLSVW